MFFRKLGKSTVSNYSLVMAGNFDVFHFNDLNITKKINNRLVSFNDVLLYKCASAVFNKNNFKRNIVVIKVHDY